MINIEQTLEFNKIKEKLSAFAYTEKAREEIKNLEPCMSEREMVKKLRETSEARIILDKMGTPPLISVNGLEEALHIAVKGGCLSAEQLETVSASLTAVRRLKDFLNLCKGMDLSLPYYEENLDELKDIKEELNQKIRGGRVDDYATKQLKNLRGGIERLETKMREKADLVLKSNKESVSDNFCTLRNGRICIPVKKEYKFKIAGTVIDKSSTGSTLFIEPVSVAKYFEELQLLKIEEENEVLRILYTLTVLVADAQEVFQQNTEVMEKLDFIFAKGKLSADYDGTAPEINKNRRIRIKNGRHPLMEKEKCVPLNFSFGNDTRGIIITGPNTGGKTVAIKTVGLHCLMAQCGLHIPCQEADLCMNNQIFCDIGDGQNIAENLSTFSAHITNVLQILKKADKESLVIMDELGSGTDPAEGMGIAIAVLEELKKCGCLYLVTTHYPEIKVYAEKTEGVINARMTFDRETLMPLYQLKIGEAGESCAFYIAQKLGMPGNMLKMAEAAAYGKETPKYITLDDTDNLAIKKEHVPSLQKDKIVKNQQSKADQFKLGDSVMVYPDKKTGIVCKTANDKGALRIQMPDRKIWVNHKRLKLQVAAQELYPENYDFSIIFDSVENRKKRHLMEKKFVEDFVIEYDEES